MSEKYKLVWSTDLTTLCEICDERDYGSPCDACMIEIMELCPNCFGQHAISAQIECGEALEDENSIAKCDHRI